MRACRSAVPASPPRLILRLFPETQHRRDRGSDRHLMSQRRPSPSPGVPQGSQEPTLRSTDVLQTPTPGAEARVAAQGGPGPHAHLHPRPRGHRMLALPVTSGNRRPAGLLPWEGARVTESLDPCPLLRCPGNGQRETREPGRRAGALDGRAARPGGPSADPRHLLPAGARARPRGPASTPGGGTGPGPDGSTGYAGLGVGVGFPAGRGGVCAQ